MRTANWGDDLRIVATSCLVVFIVLKVTGVVTWPWVWVLSPFWIICALVIVLIAVKVGLLSSRG